MFYFVFIRREEAGGFLKAVGCNLMDDELQYVPVISLFLLRLLLLLLLLDVVAVSQPFRFCCC